MSADYFDSFSRDLEKALRQLENLSKVKPLVFSDNDSPRVESRRNNSPVLNLKGSLRSVNNAEGYQSKRFKASSFT